MVSSGSCMVPCPRPVRCNRRALTRIVPGPSQLYVTLRPGYTHLMNIHPLLRELREATTTKIVLLVADGLGGLPLEPGGKTELETARTPHLDSLAREGVCGLGVPVL